MDRQKLTRTLLRMLHTVDAGDLPARVREVYVFGSYARGALNPGDLDLVVIHDDPGEEYWTALREQLREKGYGQLDVLLKVGPRFQAEMRRLLRRPGERADIILTRTAEEFFATYSKVRASDLVLPWSLQDRDFANKVRAIRPDPDAGRAPRNHFLSLKRFHDHVKPWRRRSRW